MAILSEFEIEQKDNVAILKYADKDVYKKAVEESDTVDTKMVKAVSAFNKEYVDKMGEKIYNAVDETFEKYPDVQQVKYEIPFTLNSRGKVYGVANKSQDIRNPQTGEVSKVATLRILSANPYEVVSEAKRTEWKKALTAKFINS